MSATNHAEYRRANSIQWLTEVDGFSKLVPIELSVLREILCCKMLMCSAAHRLVFLHLQW